MTARRPPMTARRPRRAARRRAAVLLAAVLAVLLPLPLAACGRGGEDAPPRLTMVGPWTGAEETTFRALLDVFAERHGIAVEYQGTTATREVLLSSVQTGDPPDVAILPGLGELADYARRGLLRPLPADVLGEEDYDQVWLSRPAGMSERYWVPVKADLKSIVWHDRSLDTRRLSAPDVSHWCIGMLSDATSGWPGSDWIEDILLQQSGPDVYDAWATGRLPWTSPPVRLAWKTWGEFMSGAPDAAATALRTDHRGWDGDGGLLLTDGRDCVLEHQGSFLRDLYPERVAARLDFTPSAALLPGATRPGRDLEVAADFAAMLLESPEAVELMRFLAAEETQRTRASGVEQPGYSAHRGVTARDYDDPVSRRIVTRLQHADRLCLDASDVMPPTVRRAFHDKTLEFLAEPGQDPAALLGDLQRAQRALPAGTRWLEWACTRP